MTVVEFPRVAVKENDRLMPSVALASATIALTSTVVLALTVAVTVPLAWALKVEVAFCWVPL